LQVWATSKPNLISAGIKQGGVSNFDAPPLSFNSYLMLRNRLSSVLDALYFDISSGMKIQDLLATQTIAQKKKVNLW
jgi:hypothetical protein